MFHVVEYEWYIKFEEEKIGYTDPLIIFIILIIIIISTIIANYYFN